MTTINNGGPAFPNHPEMPIDAPGEGMTLRDYFAAKALQGICSRPESNGWTHEGIAIAAYRQADAMLTARKIDLQQ